MNPARLIIEAGPQVGQEFVLDGKEVVIGRDPQATWTLDSARISRQHLRLYREGDQFWVQDLGSVNGSYLNGERLTAPQALRSHDFIYLGGDVRLRFVQPEPERAIEQTLVRPISAAKTQIGGMLPIKDDSPLLSVTIAGEPAQTFRLEQARYTLGRAPDNDFVIPSPLMSRHHATLDQTPHGYRLNLIPAATNPVFFKGAPIKEFHDLGSGDVLRLGSADPGMMVTLVYQAPVQAALPEVAPALDAPALGAPAPADLLPAAPIEAVAGVRVEAVGLNKWVNKTRNVLQDISLVIEPREFVVVVGQSGGGKSSLVDALAGYRPATQGRVLVNGLDSSKNFNAIRDNIGFVPQRDIIHTELTPAEALGYAARLRMPADTTGAARQQRVLEVLADLDLTDRKDQPIHTLSGGQQKRVSIGVELLNRPGLFFLDEPTSGLDPGNETALMNLMRRLADQGRTIILITHATRNVMLADKVLFLARGGHLAYFGPPTEALKYFDHYRLNRDQRARPIEFDEIYAILDDPAKGSPSDWAARFREHPAYRQYILEPLQARGHLLPAASAVKAPVASPQGARSTFRRISSIGQFFVLSARNLKILRRDRASLVLMLAAPPLVAAIDLSSAFLLGRNVFDFKDGDMYNAITSFFLSLMYAALVGAFSQMREFVKESDIYRRERLVTLRVFPYVTSKVWVASLVALYQALAFTVIHHLAYIMPGGLLEVLLFFFTIYLASLAGMLLGLFASALSPNANSAPLVVVLMVVPQLVMAGAMLPVPEFVSAFSPTRWAYQTLIGVSGAGSDVAADACWALPKAERDALDLKAKDARGCQCMGSNVVRQATCSFPGVGEYYVAAIDQPEPVEPPPLGDAPLEPVFPIAPTPPADLADFSSLATFLQDLARFQADADTIRADFSAQLRAYQASADAYEIALEGYLDDLAGWETDRNQAVGKAEGEIEFFYRNYSWTYVDKDTPATYWGKTVLGWGMIILINSVLVGLTLIIMWRKS